MTRNLFNAVLENKYFQLLNLLQNGENPNIIDEDGFTPLMRWFQYNDDINSEEQMSIPDTLLLYGSNINERSYDDNGTTVLMEEAIKNNLYTVNYLLDKGADLTIKCVSLRETAFEKAEKLGHIYIEQCLLDRCTNRSSSFVSKSRPISPQISDHHILPSKPVTAYCEYQGFSISPRAAVSLPCRMSFANQ